jgi:WD40 repeat protein
MKSIHHKWDGGQSEQCTYYNLPSIKSVSFSRDGTIASADNQGIINLWSRDGKLLTTYQGHDRSINDVRFSPDSQIIATASNDGNVKLWSPDGQLQATLQSPDGSVNNVSFSPDGKTIAAASKKGTIILWNIDLHDLLAFSCDRVRDYLKNNRKVSDLELCKGVGMPEQTQKISTGTQLQYQPQ